MNTEKHPFEPFLPSGARILFLGSFPPQEHRWCMPFYYPNWINDFWRIMGLIHFGDKEHFCVPGEKRFDEGAIREFCTREGLAFYDTATEVKRLKDNASDAFLEVVKPTDIRALLARIPECHTLVTTGEKASGIVAETFGCRVPDVGEYLEIPDQVRNEERTIRNEERTIRNEERTVRNEERTVRNEERTVRNEVILWRMPSTSRAYPLSLEKKAEAYRKLFL